MVMDVEVFVTGGLGDNSYLLVSGDEAAVVDPQRDAWRFLHAAQARGAVIRAVLETHVHNDYVSGAHEIRASTGAQIIAPAKGRYEFPHRPADEGDEVMLGDLRLVAMATPGHTFEHISWLAHEAGAPAAVFTGGSLLVGSAGRPDLLGDQHTGELTRAQYATLQRLATLPGGARVLPTHGAGSFCVAAMPATQRTSTIVAERDENPLLTARDLPEFTTELCSELMAYPAYYAHMAPINRRGAPVLGGVPDVPALTLPEFQRHAGGGFAGRGDHAAAADRLDSGARLPRGRHRRLGRRTAFLPRRLRPGPLRCDGQGRRPSRAGRAPGTRMGMGHDPRQPNSLCRRPPPPPRHHPPRPPGLGHLLQRPPCVDRRQPARRSRHPGPPHRRGQRGRMPPALPPALTRVKLRVTRATTRRSSAGCQAVIACGRSGTRRYER